MKKYLLSIAALLLGLLAHSQEADDLGNYAEVNIIPRLDLNPVFGNESAFTLGNSSLYTLFEGSASEHFSWTLANHWFSGQDFLGPEADPFCLFKGLTYSDNTNFVDLAYVDLTFGNWTFNLGKNCIATGGHEYDEYDWLVHTQLASPLWNNMSCYQWGGKVTYTTPSEMTSLSLQATTSPFGERPFASGLYTFSAQWAGEYDWFAPTWSVTALGTAPRAYTWLVSLGNEFYFGDWTIGIDWSNTAGFTEEYDNLLAGHQIHGRVTYTPSERFDITLSGNFVKQTGEIRYDDASWFDTWWNAGAIAQFYPLRDSRDLRLHALVKYDHFLKQFEFCAGILYNLNIKLW